MRSTKYWIVGLLLLLLGAGDTFAAQSLPKLRGYILEGRINRYARDYKKTFQDYLSGSFYLQLMIPEKEKMYFSRTEANPQFKIISIKDDQGNDLMNEKVTTIYSYGRIYGAGEYVYGDCLRISRLYFPSAQAKTVDVELEVTLQEGRSYKTVKITDAKNFGKEKSVKCSSGSMTVEKGDGYGFDITSDFPVEFYYIQGKSREKKQLNLKRFNTSERIFQHISYPNDREDCVYIFRYPSKSRTKNYSVAAKGLKISPDDWEKRVVEVSKSYNWKEKLSEYKAYAKAPSEMLAGGFIQHFTKSDQITWYYDGRKQKFSDNSCSSLTLEINYKVPGKGNNIKEPFSEALFFRPLKVEDDTGKDLIVDRMLVSNGGGGSSRNGVRYNVHKDVILDCFKAPDPKATKIKILSGELYCKDSKGGKHNFKVEFKDIPFDFTKCKPIGQGDSSDSSKEEGNGEEKEK